MVTYARDLQTIINYWNGAVGYAYIANNLGSFRGHSAFSSNAYLGTLSGGTLTMNDLYGTSPINEYDCNCACACDCGGG